eukprot:TRINITY_DN5753_c0_g1_i4.p1 TRINITY_DN5753_c0_g1~~TRINITY_DN5753_c0_g1_i4.p1  ORF type:complete len:1625 (-),score=489.66 TRINITY_DN5753_c0_g1_i4:385-5259(-)
MSGRPRSRGCRGGRGCSRSRSSRSCDDRRGNGRCERRRDDSRDRTGGARRQTRSCDDRRGNGRCERRRDDSRDRTGGARRQTRSCDDRSGNGRCNRRRDDSRARTGGAPRQARSPGRGDLRDRDRDREFWGGTRRCDADRERDEDRGHGSRDGRGGDCSRRGQTRLTSRTPSPARGGRDDEGEASDSREENEDEKGSVGGVALQVGGCRNKTISDIIAGTYFPLTKNHGKVVYKKEGKSRGLDVLIYFWDERDGPELGGWWFGPNVGGDQVWAYHPDRTASMPPASEWNVPHDGPIDSSFAVTPQRQARKLHTPERVSVEQAPRNGLVQTELRKQPRATGMNVAVAAAAAAAASAAAPPTAVGPGRVVSGSRSAEAAPPSADRGRQGSRKASSAPPTKQQEEEEEEEEDDQEEEEEEDQDEEEGEAEDEDAEEDEEEKEEDDEEEKEEEDEDEKESEKEEESEKEQQQAKEQEKQRAKESYRDTGRGREEKEDKDAARGEGSVSNTRAYFVEAYNKRRQERAKADEARRKEIEAKRRSEEERRRREEERRREESRAAAAAAATAGRNEDPKAAAKAELLRQVEALKREEEEEKRQLEELKKRQEERKKREEEFRRKMEVMEQAALAKRKGNVAEIREKSMKKEEEEQRKKEKEKEKEEEEEEEQRRREEEEKKERRREQEKKREEERQKQNEERRKVDERRREEAKEERRKKAEEEERRRSNERRRDAERRREMDRREIDRRRDDERRREDDNRRRARSRDRSRDALRRRTRSRDRSREDAIRRRTRSRDRSREDAIRRRTRNQDKSREDTVRRRTRSRDRSREERRRQDDEVLRKHNNDGAKDQPERVKAQDAKRKEKDEDRGQKEQDGRTEKEQDTDREQQKEEADGKGKEDKNVEESKTKKELEAMRQQQATLSVLRVLQKLSNANPDNFQTLKGELDDVLEKELPQTGSQRDALRAEADRVIDYAKQYVEQIREQQRKLEEMRGEQQKKSVEDQEATAKAMLEELKELVSAAEIASETVHDAVGPLAGENDLEDDHVLKIASEVEATGKTALGACSACADFILTKRPLIEESLKTKGDSPKAASIKAEFLDAIAKSNPRIQVSTRQATEALQTAKASRERITRKMASARWNERLANLFREYDRDGDSLLNRAEVAAYAKGEFAFEMPEDNLNRISRQLFKPPAEGVEMQNFQLLKSAVGIARDEVKQLARRAQRLEKERVDREAVKERGASLQTKASKQTAQLTELENTVKLIELDVEVISKEALELTGQAVKVKSDALEEKAQGVNTAIASVLQEAQVGCNEAAEAQAQVDCKQAAEAQDVVSALPSTFKMINSRAHTLMLQLRRGTNKLITVRKHALEAEFTKFETLRLEVVTKLRIAFEAQGGKVDAIFDSVSTDGERVTKADLRTFVAKQECGIDVAKLDAVFFAPWSALGDGTTGDTPTEKKEAALVDGIGRQDFVRLCRLHYRVVKEIVVSDDLRIEKSKQLRRMEVGEIMEVLIGPAMDPSVGVYRVNGKAFKDGISGWVTVAGNGGITFLAPGGNVFKVRKRVGLSEELKDVSVEKCVRHLVEGEVLDLVDWARTSRSALGVTRVQVKARADGAIGWATITDSDGATFLEAR